ncbi:MAG: hypothetical protein DHS20C14_12160 [Phycisphaeraceae bacterium]|nr:MAG: hypothetical protein DHS20C14_12160 [Phycisphaeraceae bacterium]
MNQSPIRLRTIVRAAAVIACATGVGVGAPVQPETADDTPSLIQPDAQRDGLAYPVTGFTIEYPLAHPDLPDPEAVFDVLVPLTRTDAGWLGPVEGVEPEYIRLGSFNDGQTRTIYGSALATINTTVRDALEVRWGLIGHLVTPAIDEIAYETTSQDLRQPGETGLTIQVWRAAVGEVRSIGFGQKWDRYARKRGVGDEPKPEARGSLDHPSHARIRDRSPVQEGDILRRPAMDREIHHLNRHPGRRVDISLAPSGEPGEVVLDYLVTEAKDWSVYYQISNTGTENTDPWVHRFGYLNNQLTGREDVFQLDYITAGFDETHAVLGSYEFRIHPSGRLRARVYGRWNEYSASDVGIGGDAFLGTGYEVGAEVIGNVWQDDDRFIDLVGGFRWERIEVDNRLLFITGEEDFFLPYVAVRAERVSALRTFFGEAKLEVGTGGDRNEIFKLGRFNVSEQWATLKGSASYSFFLEPLLNPDGFEGLSDPNEMTLAHEIFLSARGQWSFNDRLVPNFQQTAGGFYTVRGYDESEAVGDNAVVATAEYRFHLGRALPATDELSTFAGRPFRLRRTQPYGAADWDVIFRGFMDAAAVASADRNTFSESNDTLLSVGVGTEVRVKNNITLRLDYGVALSDVGAGALKRAEAGDSRLHFQATLLF